jgi:hypothetical protein
VIFTISQKKFMEKKIILFISQMRYMPRHRMSTHFRRLIRFAVDDAVIGSKKAGFGTRVDLPAELVVDRVGGHPNSHLCPDLRVNNTPLARTHNRQKD